MQVEISPATQERLQVLVDRGEYPDLTAALEGVVAEVAEYDDEYEAELTRKLDRARESVRAGRFVPLTHDLAEQIKREARAERDARLPH